MKSAKQEVDTWDLVITHSIWMWDKCQKCQSAVNAFQLLQICSLREKKVLRPFDLFLQRRSSSVQQTPGGSGWRANTFRRERRVCLWACEEKEEAGVEVFWVPWGLQSSRVILMGFILLGRDQWCVKETSDRQRLLVLNCIRYNLWCLSVCLSWMTIHCCYLCLALSSSWCHFLFNESLFGRLASVDIS